MDYVQRLAGEAGVDPGDTEAVVRFDRAREGVMPQSKPDNRFS